MTLITLPVSRPAPAPAAREHIVLTGVSWETYLRLRKECDRLHMKMTFDGGTLEIMPPLPAHAIVTRFIDQMITTLCDEMRIAVVGYRDTTWQNRTLEKGLEADDCYYIQNAELADRLGASIDIDRHPPPDLAVETDLTHSTADKESVYAALGVPELWRWDEGTLRIRILGSDGHYADAVRSLALPMLLPEIVEVFVRQRLQEGEWRAKNAFRDWVRANVSGQEDS